MKTLTLTNMEEKNIVLNSIQCILIEFINLSPFQLNLNYIKEFIFIEFNSIHVACNVIQYFHSNGI
jgi:hypothetical protein